MNTELCFPQFPIDTWVRKCNECGHEQSAVRPNLNKELTDAYRNAKCRKCKSEALDYGRLNCVDGDWYED